MVHFVSSSELLVCWVVGLSSSIQRLFRSADSASKKWEMTTKYSNQTSQTEAVLNAMLIPGPPD